MGGGGASGYIETITNGKGAVSPRKGGRPGNEKRSLSSKRSSLTGIKSSLLSKKSADELLIGITQLMIAVELMIIVRCLIRSFAFSEKG